MPSDWAVASITRFDWAMTAMSFASCWLAVVSLLVMFELCSSVLLST